MLALRRILFRNYQIHKLFSMKAGGSCRILGIETSCDDTGCAIINEKGNVLGETLHSQNLVHLRNGGIIPDIAQDLHRSNIESVVNSTLEKADLPMADITAIAVTLEPGLPLSLVIGMKYAKYLSRKYDKPIIPIHHMQAHALTARMENNVSFPFLVLLISGGHCILAVAEDVNKFKILGESMDCAPGEVFDKVARRMKLRNVPEYSTICGGSAVERAASKATNPMSFKLPLPLADQKDCNFSFNGLKTAVLRHLHLSEVKNKVVADQLVPDFNDLCAALMIATSKHLVHRLQRAIQFCETSNLLPQNHRQLVVSGGVACNNIIYNSLKLLCTDVKYELIRPTPKLCTDNGIMIAWNGVEKWRNGVDVVSDISKLDIRAISPMGESLIPDVVNARIRTKMMKMKFESQLGCQIE